MLIGDQRQVLVPPNQQQEASYYQSREYDHLSRFFLGGKPFAEVSPDHSVSLVFLIDARTPGVEFYLANGLVEFDYALEVSEDLENWTELSGDQVFSVEENLNGGAMRVRIHTIANSEVISGQFLRARIREKS